MSERLPNGRFLPGNTASVGHSPSRRDLPDDLKGIKRFHPEHLERMMLKMLEWTKDEFEAQMKDPAASMLSLLMGSIMMKGIVKGEPIYLDFILKRFVDGNLEVKADGTVVNEALREVPREDIIAYLKDRRKVVSGA